MKKIHTLIKKIVEEGTSHSYTLLHIPANDNKILSIQAAVKQSIFIQHNTCGHKYEIIFGDFLQSKKVCKVCTSAGLSIKYSQHNMLARLDVFSLQNISLYIKE